MIYFDFPKAYARMKVDINDDRLISCFGESYKWEEGLGEIIELMIRSGEEYRFRNAKALQDYIQRDYVNNKYLNLDIAPVFPGTPVQIVMTGSRTSDAAAADNELERKLGGLPDYSGYTWHHKEDIVGNGSRWYCNMYLVESGYHRRHPHRGGVYMYSFFTGRTYS